MSKPRSVTPDIFFAGFVDGKPMQRYPAWRYHELFEPIIVTDTAADDAAVAQGYRPPEEPITAMPRICNYFHDLEDFNAEQLLAYAREEFGVRFPRQATKEMLIKAIWHLYYMAPKHKGRMVLLAQSVRMNYDETVAEIRRQAENPTEWETKEVAL